MQRSQNSSKNTKANDDFLTQNQVHFQPPLFGKPENYQVQFKEEQKETKPFRTSSPQKYSASAYDMNNVNVNTFNSDGHDYRQQTQQINKELRSVTLNAAGGFVTGGATYAAKTALLGKSTQTMQQAAFDGMIKKTAAGPIIDVIKETEKYQTFKKKITEKMKFKHFKESPKK